jgi:hypothetical protein
VVRRLRERQAIGPFRLVYGSQNVEHPLKRAIFRQYHVQCVEPVLDAIQALERESAGEAELVAAVTREDAAHIAGWTAAPVVLAPNGVTPWQSHEPARKRWRARTGGRAFALYVASAHPPNVAGFCESFGTCLAALSPAQALVLVGSVGGHIAQSAWFRQWGPLNERRVVVAGVVSDEELSAVRDAAHTFVVPMTSGGGSNLKTAEALFSGRHVVTTPLGLRGFEAYADLPGVVVAQPGPAFAKAVARSLALPLPETGDVAARRRETLTWSHTLAALCDAVQAIRGAANA